MMIICDDCGKEYPDYLTACPTCGSTNHNRNISKSAVRSTAGTSLNGYAPLKQVGYAGSFGGGFVLVFLLGYIPLLFICAFGAQKTRNGAAAAGLIGIIIRIILIILTIPLLLSRY